MERAGPTWVRLLLLAVALTAAGCSGSDDGPSSSARSGDEGASVVAAFDDYKSALIAQDGEAAAGVAADATLDYYDEMRILALTATRREVKSLRLVDQLFALGLRHFLPPARLQKMDGFEVFEYSVDEGMISENAVSKMEPTDADVSGDRALLSVEIDGAQAPFTFVLVREDGSWKMDMTELLKLSDSAFQSLADQSGKSDEAFLMQLLTSMSGTKPSNDIWKPPAR